MTPAGFEYHAPRSIADAVRLLGELGPDAKLLAGGHSLLPMMKLRFAQPGHLIDLGKIAELKGIREDGGALRIGAMTTENELIWSKLIQDKCPLLVEGARLISDPQVRYKGTIGGDISHGDPGNDHPALMLVLGASFVLRGAKGERVVPADGFFLGGYATLMGLVLYPNLYRCGVAWVAVTDPRLLWDESWQSDSSEESRKYGLPTLIGDPQADAEMLKAAAPLEHAADIRAPVFLAFGGQDRRVPLMHGTRMRDALRAQGHDPEWVVYEGEGHGWLKVENRVDFWSRVERFLTKSLEPRP